MKTIENEMKTSCFGVHVSFTFDLIWIENARVTRTIVLPAVKKRTFLPDPILSETVVSFPQADAFRQNAPYRAKISIGRVLFSGFCDLRTVSVSTLRGADRIPKSARREKLIKPEAERRHAQRTDNGFANLQPGDIHVFNDRRFPNLLDQSS